MKSINKVISIFLISFFVTQISGLGKNNRGRLTLRRFVNSSGKPTTPNANGGQANSRAFTPKSPKKAQEENKPAATITLPTHTLSLLIQQENAVAKAEADAVIAKAAEELAELYGE